MNFLKRALSILLTVTVFSSYPAFTSMADRIPSSSESDDKSPIEVNDSTCVAAYFRDIGGQFTIETSDNTATKSGRSYFTLGWQFTRCRIHDDKNIPEPQDQNPSYYYTVEPETIWFMYPEAWDYEYLRDCLNKPGATTVEAGLNYFTHRAPLFGYGAGPSEKWGKGANATNIMTPEMSLAYGFENNVCKENPLHAIVYSGRPYENTSIKQTSTTICKFEDFARLIKDAGYKEWYDDFTKFEFDNSVQQYITNKKQLEDLGFTDEQIKKYADTDEWEYEEALYMRADAIMTYCRDGGTLPAPYGNYGTVEKVKMTDVGILMDVGGTASCVSMFLNGDYSNNRINRRAGSESRVYVNPLKLDSSLPTNWSVFLPHDADIIKSYKEFISFLMSKGFRSTTPTAIEEHFNNYVPIWRQTLTVRKTPEVPKPKYDNFGKPEAYVYDPEGKYEPPVNAWNTYNTSVHFDLSKGIPSSEDITNGINTNTWFGAASIKLKRQVSSGDIYKTQITVKYKYPKTVHHSDGHTSTEWKSTSYKKSWTPKRYASYYYIENIALYGYDNAVVSNDTYPGGKIKYHYGEDGETLSYRVTVNNEEINSAGGSNFTTFDPNDKYHISWYSCDANWNPTNGITKDITVDIGKASDSKAKKEWNKQKNALEKRIKEATVRNDHLEVNGEVYMDGTDTNLNYEKVREWHNVKGEGDFGPYAGLNAATGTSNIGRENHERTVTIPPNKANGQYPTSMEITYRQIVGQSLGSPKTYSGFGVPIISAEKEERNPDHPTRSYTVNEPVFVHTPVISPVYVSADGTSERLSNDTELMKTPLTKDYSTYVDVNLRLDENYNIEFDKFEHRDIQNYGDSSSWGSPDYSMVESHIKYDKYTAKKQIRFPFDVKVNDRYFSTGGNGYTEWIDVHVENWDELPFYIPSWAKEGIYGASLSGHFNANPRFIEVRVIPINFESKVKDTDTPKDHVHDDTDDEYGRKDAEEAANKEIENYIAYYKIAAQVTGYIYGFELTGLSGNTSYWDADTKDTSVCLSKALIEHKVGTNNRLGMFTQRESKTGYMKPSGWSKIDTTPIANGKSHLAKTTYLTYGDTLWFTLETLGSLNGDNDRIEIIPEYRYVMKTGDGPHDYVVLEDVQFKLFYNCMDEMAIRDSNGFMDPKNLIHKASKISELTIDPRSKITKEKLCMSDKNFAGTYTDDERQFSLAYKRNLWDMDLDSYFYPYMRYEDIGCADYVKITNYHELYVGDSARIAKDKYFNDATGKGNLSRSKSDAITYFDDTFPVANVDGTIKDLPNEAFDARLRASIQKWFGKYHIPSAMYVCKKGNSPDESWANGVAVTKDSDFWIKTPGWLILRFKIRTIHNGVEHLSYYEGDGHFDMWATERTGNAVTANVGAGKYYCEDVPIRSGDVAFIMASPGDKAKGEIHPVYLWLN